MVMIEEKLEYKVLLNLFNSHIISYLFTITLHAIVYHPSRVSRQGMMVQFFFNANHNLPSTLDLLEHIQID